MSLAPRGACNPTGIVHKLCKSPSTSQRFVAVPTPLDKKEIIEVGSAWQKFERPYQQIVEVSVPQVAEQFCAGMCECSEKEAWLDGSPPACELHNAFCVVGPS